MKAIFAMPHVLPTTEQFPLELVTKMRFPKILLVSLPLVVPSVTHAADVNGYTAQFELNVGSAPACSAIIDSVNDSDWNRLNDPAYPVICIAPGDYSSRGAITLTVNGSPSNKRWLRYYNSANSNPPWEQSAPERAKLNRLVFSSANYWIIDGITVDDGGAVQEAVKFMDGTNAKNNVVNRVLIENSGDHLVSVASGNDDNSIQNSVLRNCVVAPGLDSSAISISGNVRNTRIVNNEIYNCVKGVYVSEHGAAGTIVENNDIYINTDRYTNCNGSLTTTGTCSAAEVLIGMKSGGTSSNPVLIIKNRMWGMRAADTSVCCAGGGAQGDAVGLDGNGDGADPNTTGTKYTMLRNNIVMDSQHGITSYWDGVRNNSMIGNILYNIRRYSTKFQSYAFSAEGGYNSSSEWYLNTIVDSDVWMNFGVAPNSDVRCNLAINSGSAASSPGSGSQVTNNAYYATSGTATDNSANSIARFQVVDSKNTSFCFTRKLLTNPEQVCIPNAKSTAQSPHYRACTADIGTRAGIGINDIAP